MRSQKSGVSPRSEPRESRWTRRPGEATRVPLLMAVVPIVGLLVGWFLDRRLATFPGLTILLLIVGFIAAARELWISAKQPPRKSQQPS